MSLPKKINKNPTPAYASQVSIFNPPDHISTAHHRYKSDLQQPDCTLGLLNYSKPAGDPVDSDHFAGSPLQATDGLIRAGLSYPVRTLTVFTRLAC